VSKRSRCQACSAESERHVAKRSSTHSHSGEYPVSWGRTALMRTVGPIPVGHADTVSTRSCAGATTKAAIRASRSHNGAGWTSAGPSTAATPPSRSRSASTGPGLVHGPALGGPRRRHGGRGRRVGAAGPVRLVDGRRRRRRGRDPAAFVRDESS
jgi:hypothetical protein